MYSTLQLAKKFLKYYLTASNRKGHGMHSPFVYDLIRNVINNGNGYALPSAVEEARKKLLSSHEEIVVEDFGAGSRKKARATRKVADIAKHALKSPKYAAFLYRLAHHYKPATVMELGTSLGITSAYLAKAVPDSTVYTIEGSGAVREKAVSVFNDLGIQNIESVKGEFDLLLPEILTRVGSVDLAYVDGNHRKEPTVRYFHALLEKADNNSIMAFDDIHWSSEMEAAWEEIKNHQSVRCSIDLFFLGIVFFRQEFKEPVHFTIRF